MVYGISGASLMDWMQNINGCEMFYREVWTSTVGELTRILNETCGLEIEVVLFVTVIFRVYWVLFVLYYGNN